MLQQVWRWLTEKKHGISQFDRGEIFALFKKAALAPEKVSFEEMFHKLLQDTLFEDSDQARQYFEGLYNLKESFALCFRSHLPLRGNNTNNFVEAQFLVLKDVILRRTKEYNVVALLEKLLKDMEQHYKDKLLSISANTFEGYTKLFKGFKLPTDLEKERGIESLEMLPNDVFLMDSIDSSKNQKYTIDMSLGLCSCPIGKDGSACKHQYIIWVSGLANCLNFTPVSSQVLRQEHSLR